MSSPCLFVCLFFFFPLQEAVDTKQDEILTRLPKSPAELAKVPRGAPSRKSWYVQRQQVTETVRESLFREGGPHFVGLVGDSGSGKTTTASEIVRNAEVRDFFSDGIFWVSVDRNAKDRLGYLMLELAKVVHDDLGRGLGRAPARASEAAKYIKDRISGRHQEKSLRCLLVADNVWESEVVAKLLATGMWVLTTSRDEGLVECAGGEPVAVDELSEEEAESLLVGASELPIDTRLAEAAKEITKLCGRRAMDLAFVGRWSTVRGRGDTVAWSDAAKVIRAELKGAGLDVDGGSEEGEREKQRRAVLRAGFDDLAIATNDDRVQKLYLSLGVMPDGHAFSAKDAAVLLFGRPSSAEDEEAVGEVVETLERWAVLKSADEKFRMHDAHSSFARESLVDREYVRRPATERWVEHLSSLKTLRSSDTFVMMGLWWALERVKEDAWREDRPYEKEIANMDDSDPLCRESLVAVARFRRARGDRPGEKAMYARLLKVEQKRLGPHDPNVVSTLWHLGNCAEGMGHLTEAREWRQKEYETVHLALARIRAEGGHGEKNSADGLRSLASGMLRLAPERLGEAEKLLRRAVEIEEARLGPNDAQVSNTLHQLGVCVREAGRRREAEEILRRALEIKEAKLGPTNVYVAVTLHELGVCIREAGRLEEAEALLRRSLQIWEGKLGLATGCIAYTMQELSMCARKEGGKEGLAWHRLQITHAWSPRVLVVFTLLSVSLLARCVL